jgi:hypothetical protein
MTCEARFYRAIGFSRSKRQNKPVFCFRPGLVNNCGSIRIIRFFPYMCQQEQPGKTFSN